MNSNAPKTKQKWGDSPSRNCAFGKNEKYGGYADEEGGL